MDNEIREQFDSWFAEEIAIYEPLTIKMVCGQAYQARQPEIDELKAENERLKGVIEDLQNQIFDEHQEKVFLAGRNE